MSKKKVIIIVSILLVSITIIVIGFNSKKSYAVGTTLVDTVKALNKGSSWSAGDSGVYYTNSHEYRYIGAEVNNYVKFNNDMYRIIGVFDSNSHGKSGEMIKLIRSRPLGGYSWGVYNSSNTSGTYSNYGSDWTGTTTGVKANLNVLLNEYFYNKSDNSSTYGPCSNWTYYGTDNDYRTNSCSRIVGYGIDESLRGYIETTTWYLYGSGDYQSKQNWYLCERGGNSCKSANSGAYSTTTDVKIGLMYLSDYLYASSYYTSSNTSTQINYYFSNNNWLHKGYEWLLTPKTNSSNSVWYVNSSLYDFSMPGANMAYAFRPTFYLKSSVYVTGGNGSFDNPFTLGCDDCN